LGLEVLYTLVYFAIISQNFEDSTMNYIKSLSSAGTSVGLGTLLAVGLSGCGGQSQEQSATQQQKQPAFVVIEEVAQGKYKIAEEFPAKETRIILKKLDGSERVLTEQELDYLIKQEAAKVEEGTSNLTKPKEAQVTQHGGMGLGETILASAAGYMLGAWIGSKLFGNPAYQNNRKAGYKSPSTYSRSKSSFKKSAAKRTAAKKGGFFGNKKKSGGFFGGKRRSGGFFGG
jgi:hypothetical protein